MRVEFPNPCRANRVTADEDFEGLPDTIVVR